MQKYSQDNVLAFHTPGHKHGIGAHKYLHKFITPEGFKQEVSLMDELDNLQNPHSCIKRSQELAAELWHADEVFFCVNGTTSAIQAMIFGTLSPGDLILIPRNAHRSVIAGLILSGAIPIFLPVEYWKKFNIPLNVSVATIKKAIEIYPQAKAVLLVSPSYYGISADIKAIAELVHKAGMILMIDEAHGAHLQFCDELPISAMDAGADLAAQSTHKVLGSLTQTSMLMVRKGLINLNRLKAVVGFLQTTSPNQLLLASLDASRLQMSFEGRKRVSEAVELSKVLRTDIKKIHGLKIFETVENFEVDWTKVVVNVEALGLTGSEVEKFLRREQRIQCELSDATNILFLLTYSDTLKSTTQLIEALKKLPQNNQGLRIPTFQPSNEITTVKISPRESLYLPTRNVDLKAAVGNISAEEITAYPPGIPIIVPGEEITSENIAMIYQYKDLKKQAKQIRILVT